MAFSGTLSKVHTIGGTLSGVHNVNGRFSAPSYIRQTNYEELDNKPQINSVELIGNKTSAELRLQDPIAAITYQEIDSIIFG